MHLNRICKDTFSYRKGNNFKSQDNCFIKQCFMNFLFQALPCTLGMIESNPTLAEDHCSGIILATMPLIYQAFDNKVAAGKQLRD